jgi:hypothetical protein
LGRIIAVLVIGWALLTVYGLIGDTLDGLPLPITTGADGIRAAGIAGLTVMPLLGVPLALVARWYPDGPEWLPSVDVPIMFVVWAVATMAIVG